MDIRPNNWEDRVLLLATHLIHNKKKATTVKSYISAIKAVLLENGYELCENKFLLNSITRACKLVNDKVTPCFPIKKGMLRMILNRIELEFQSQTYLAKLYRAMCAAAYFGLLRMGEITKSDHNIKATDVHLATNKNKILFILRSSKTLNKSALPQSVKISSNQLNKPGSGKFNTAKWGCPCPYVILRQYISMRKKSTTKHEAFFVYKNQQLVSAESFRKVLRNAIRKEGFYDLLYNCHSLRIRQSCDLQAMGISVETIRKLGRWKSNSVYSYLHTE